MIFSLLVRDVMADMSEFNGNLFHVYKYFEFLAYFILAFVVLQLILFIIFLVSILSRQQKSVRKVTLSTRMSLFKSRIEINFQKNEFFSNFDHCL